MSAGVLGSPRVHYRVTDSTNARARELAARGAPHGTLVTAAEQSEGRGRQGRTWSAPAARALLCSIVIRDPPRLLPLVAGIAVAEVVDAGVPRVEGGVPEVEGGVPEVEGGVPEVEGGVPEVEGGVPEVEGGVPEVEGGVPRVEARIKWPNDILIAGRKVAGILVEGRPQEQWAVVGIGLNVALRNLDFPPELREIAGTMGLEPSAIEPTLGTLLRRLERWIAADPAEVLDAVRARDALLGCEVRWGQGEGTGAGIDGDGRLLVITASGRVVLDAGEVHLVRQGQAM